MLANAKLAPPFQIQDYVWLNPTQQGGGLYPSGSWVLYFDGVNDEVNFGSDASLDNIPNSASITVEGWFRIDANSNFRHLVGKNANGITGWFARIDSDGKYRVFIECDTTNAISVITAASVGLDAFADGTFHHFCFVYDDTGDKKVYIAVDGVWASSYVGQTQGVNTYSGDAAYSMYTGESAGANWDLLGAHGWIRLSDTRRYTPSVDFDVPRDLPAADGNTIEQWPVDDGSGSTVAASVSSPANDGTITGAQWIKG